MKTGLKNALIFNLEDTSFGNIMLEVDKMMKDFTRQFNYPSNKVFLLGSNGADKIEDSAYANVLLKYYNIGGSTLEDLNSPTVSETLTSIEKHENSQIFSYPLNIVDNTLDVDGIALKSLRLVHKLRNLAYYQPCVFILPFSLAEKLKFVKDFNNDSLFIIIKDKEECMDTVDYEIITDTIVAEGVLAHMTDNKNSLTVTLNNLRHKGFLPLYLIGASDGDTSNYDSKIKDETGLTENNLNRIKRCIRKADQSKFLYGCKRGSKDITYLTYKMDTVYRLEDRVLKVNRANLEELVSELIRLSKTAEKYNDKLVFVAPYTLCRCIDECFGDAHLNFLRVNDIVAEDIEGI